MGSETIGEVFYTGFLKDGAKGFQAAYDRYVASQQGSSPTLVLLNPGVKGPKVEEAIRAAKALGLKVQRDSSVLEGEIWVGG